MKKLVIIDAYGLLFRAYFALPNLTTKTGVNIGAINGFINMLIRIINELKFDYLLIARDSKGLNFRHEISPSYKANREAPPNELIEQFSILQEALDAFNIVNLAVSGYEADDIIATVVNEYHESFDIDIVACDKDLFQLMSDKVKIFNPIKHEYITNEYLLNKFGITSDKLLDFLSIVGDKSDNVIGVPGIGIKGASQLLNEFESLEKIYENIDLIKQKKKQQILSDNKDNAFLSKQLITLNDKVPIELDIENTKFDLVLPETMKLFLRKYDLSNLEKRLSNMLKYTSNDVENDVKNITTDFPVINMIDQVDIKDIYNKIKREGIISIYSDGDKIDVAVGIKYIFKCDIDEKFKSFISKVFLDDSIIKIFYSYKNISKLLHIHCDNYHDIEIMYSVLNTGESDTLDHVWNKYHNNMEFNKEYSSYYVMLLYNEIMCEIIDINIYHLYYYFDKPLLNTLINVEENGIILDVEYSKVLSKELKDKLHIIEASIYKESGADFNIGSPKQLGSILFEKIGLPRGKKNKSGGYSTDSSILEKLDKDGYKIAKDVLEWRKLSKLLTTYVNVLPNHINPNTNRIHTNYSMFSTNTGRLSSSNPNLQNIPIRDKTGVNIRKAFISKDGYKFISFDYSQIELRLLADMANVKVLKEALVSGKDIHSITASKIFSIPLEEVDDNYRRKAKTINFGIIYGMSAFGLAERLGIDNKSASQYIKNYFEIYPEIKQYMDDQISLARKNEYVSTLFNRRCNIKAINSANITLRNFSERAAINAPLQGTASDIMRRAIITVNERIKNEDANILLQIHDELLLEVNSDKIDHIIRIVKEIMENICFLNINLPVNVSIGENWGDMESVDYN